jgi:hypothetical protein
MKKGSVDGWNEREGQSAEQEIIALGTSPAHKRTGEMHTAQAPMG